MQRSLTERLERSRLQWAGHVERMADERLPKRAAELHEHGRRRRGWPRLSWEDCVKRDVKKTGEEGDWKKNNNNTIQYNIFISNIEHNNITPTICSQHWDGWKGGGQKNILIVVHPQHQLILLISLSM